MITSLFQMADFLQEKEIKKGVFNNHITILDNAARHLTQGYLNLEDANNEISNRLDEFGNEIYPCAVYTAVNYLREKR